MHPKWWFVNYMAFIVWLGPKFHVFFLFFFLVSVFMFFFFNFFQKNVLESHIWSTLVTHRYSDFFFLLCITVLKEEQSRPHWAWPCGHPNHNHPNCNRNDQLCCQDQIEFEYSLSVPRTLGLVHKMSLSSCVFGFSSE